MAADDLDLIDDDLEVLTEEEEDNARALTSGLVIGTSVILLIALFVMLSALGDKFGVGPFAG